MSIDYNILEKKMKIHNKLIIMSLCATSMISATSHADLTNSYSVKVRGNMSTAESKDRSFSLPNSNLVKTGHKLFGNGYGADIAGNYFIHNNISLEASVALTSYKLSNDFGTVVNSAANQFSTTNLSYKESKKRAYLIPFSLIAQYQIMPSEQISPYIGAGVHYTVVQGSSSIAKVDNFAGFVAQAGFDLWDKEQIAFNVNANKYWGTTKVSHHSVLDASGAPLQSKIKIDPLVLSAGVGWRF